MKHGLVLTGLALTFLVVIASAATLAELGYGPGDWLRYRYSITAGGNKCVYIIKVTVKDVQGTIVKYDAGVEKLESGDSEKCSSLGGLLIIGLAFSSATSKDVSSQGPETGDFFINPQYSGGYTTSSGDKVYYRNGVLVKKEGESTTGVVITYSAELIDTSIGWLKQEISRSPFTQQLLIIIAIVAVVAVGVAVYFIARRRRTVKTPPPQPQPQPGVPGS
mgnify:CR=1 FL=1